MKKRKIPFMLIMTPLILLGSCNLNSNSTSDANSSIFSSGSITDNHSSENSSEETSVFSSSNQSSEIISEEIDSSEIFSSEEISENISSEIISSEASSEDISMTYSFRNLNGSFTRDNDNNFVSNRNLCLGIFMDGFNDITISCDISSNGKTGDNGVIFCATVPTSGTNVWEGSGISYYFYFISQNGTCYLGKTTNGTWSVLYEKAIPSYDKNKEYNLKVNKVDNVIYCYLEDELIGAYLDQNPLQGHLFGFRAGTSKATFHNLSISETVGIVGEDIEGFNIVSGSFIKAGEVILAEKTSSIMIDENTFDSGRVDVDTFIPSVGSNGLVFNYISDNSSTSYMYYSINSDKSVSLYKVVNGVSTLIKNTSLVAKYSSGAKVTLSIVIEDNKVYTYIDDVCLITANAENNGNVGLISTLGGGMFSNYQMDLETTKITADIVIWGHSHTQLWDNYKKDLDGYGKVINMGIGGSDTPYWGRLIEEMTSYEANTMIVMTGSNDIPTRSVDFVMEEEEKIYSELRKINPNIKIILITEFLQPCRLDYGEKVRELNARYFDYQDKHDFITVVDAYDIPLNSDGSLNETMFRDIYHLTTAGYDILKVRIRACLDNTYTYDQLNRYEVITGNVSYQNNLITASEESLVIKKGIRLIRGEISAEFYLENYAGLIFAYDGSSYYKANFKEDLICLSKVVEDNETIIETKEIAISKGNHELKVNFADGDIKVYLDDELQISSSDNAYLTGNKLGFTLGENDQFKNIEYHPIEGKYIFSVGDETSWSITSDNEGNKIYTSLVQDQLLMFKDIVFDGGTIEFDMQVNVDIDQHAYTVANGVVFGATSLNVNHSDGTYYVFGRCPWGTMTGFSKNNGDFRWEDSVKGGIDIPVGTTQHYKIVWNKERATLEIYVDGILKGTNSFVVKSEGSYVGIYCSSKNTVISNLSFESE